MRFMLLLMAGIARGGLLRTWAVLTMLVFALAVYAMMMSH